MLVIYGLVCVTDVITVDSCIGLLSVRMISLLRTFFISAANSGNLIREIFGGVNVCEDSVASLVCILIIMTDQNSFTLKI